MIFLSQHQYDEILRHALLGLPNESCGLVGGSEQGTNRIVEKVYPLTNVDESAEHFSMNPAEQFGAIKDLRYNGWVLLGNFHSHPSTPARPSEEDKRLAFDPDLSYLILSLADREHPVIKSYRIRGNDAREESLAIVADCTAGSWQH